MGGDGYTTTAPAVHDILASHIFIMESAVLYFSY